MRELELGGMQEIARQGQRGSGLGADLGRGTIELVPNHGMANRREVDTNLVRASGFNAELQERELSVRGVDPAFDVVMSDGFTATAATGGHPNATNGITTDRCGYGAVVLLDPAVDQSNVGFLDAAAGELVRELAMG